MDAGEWEAGRVARIASLAQGLTRVRRASAATTTLTKHEMRESSKYVYTVRGAASAIVCRSKRSPKIAMRDDAMRWEEKRFEQGSSYFDRKKGVVLLVALYSSTLDPPDGNIPSRLPILNDGWRPARGNAVSNPGRRR